MLYRMLRPLYVFYVGLLNHVFTHIPLNWLRILIYRHLYLMKIGKGTYIGMGCEFRKPRWIKIGDNCHINGNCFLDGRKTLNIGDNVDIAEYVITLCGVHDVQSADYRGITYPIIIGNRASIFTHAMITRGITVGEGGVIGAASVVTKDVPPYTIVAGNPAKKIGERNRNLDYTLNSPTVNQTW